MQAYYAEMWQQPARSACPECGGTGFVRIDVPHEHKDFGKIEPCLVCSEGPRRDWLEKYSGLEGLELDRRLTDWVPGAWGQEVPELRECRRAQRIQAHIAMEQVINARAGLLTFWGDFGGGKTMAIQTVVNELRLRMTEAFYTPFAGLLDHLRSLYSQGNESSHFWQRMLDVPVLAVDEVTRFNETAWAREKLFILVDTRYRRRDSHLTLFATNDDPRQVLPTSEDVGYVYSRMRQGQLIELRGDMRGIK